MDPSHLVNRSSNNFPRYARLLLQAFSARIFLLAFPTVNFLLKNLPSGSLQAKPLSKFSHRNLLWFLLARLFRVWHSPFPNALLFQEGILPKTIGTNVPRTEVPKTNVPRTKVPKTQVPPASRFPVGLSTPVLSRFDDTTITI